MTFLSPLKGLILLQNSLFEFDTYLTSPYLILHQNHVALRVLSLPSSHAY